MQYKSCDTYLHAIPSTYIQITHISYILNIYWLVLDLFLGVGLFQYCIGASRGVSVAVVTSPLYRTIAFTE